MQNVTGSPGTDTFELAYNTLLGNRFSWVKTFLLITRAHFKIIHVFCVFENEERLVMFNLASKNVFAKN